MGFLMLFLKKMPNSAVMPPMNCAQFVFVIIDHYNECNQALCHLSIVWCRFDHKQISKFHKTQVPKSAL